MKSTLEKPRVSSSFSRRTLTWVGGVHILIILVVALIPLLSRSKPKEKLLEVVTLGSINPGTGSISGSENGGSSSARTVKTPDAQTPPPPPLEPKRVSQTPPPDVKPVRVPAEIPVEPQRVKPEPIQPEPKVEKVRDIQTAEKTQPLTVKQESIIKKVTPQQPKPEVKATLPKSDPVKPPSAVKKSVKSEVKVDLTKVVKRTSPAAPDKASEEEDSGQEGSVDGGKKEGVKGGVVGSNGKTLEAKGPSASDLKKALTEAMPSVGVVNGSGMGAAGSPDGSAYNSLIKKTLTGNWSKPRNSGGSLKTLVKIRVKPDGSMESLGIFESSGNKAMDQSVLDAVRSTGRLAKPLPNELGSPDYDVVVNFQLD